MSSQDLACVWLSLQAQGDIFSHVGERVATDVWGFNFFFISRVFSSCYFTIVNVFELNPKRMGGRRREEKPVCNR